jgi:hypothetical protein
MIKGNLYMFVYKYENISLFVDEKSRNKNILFNIVFAQDNMHASNYILNTTHLPANTTSDTNHNTSTAHCTQ